MMEDSIRVSMLEMLRLDEMKVRHEKIQLGHADMIASLFKKLFSLNPETSQEELEETQNQIRAMLNETDEMLKEIDEDKQFVEMLMERNKGDDK